MTTKSDLERACALIAPVLGHLHLAIERKALKRSSLVGAIGALRQAADLLEGIK